MRNRIVTLRTLACIATGSVFGVSACSLVAGIGDLPFPESVSEAGSDGSGPEAAPVSEATTDDGPAPGSPDARGPEGDAGDGAPSMTEAGPDALVDCETGLDAAEETSPIGTGGDAGVQFIQANGDQVTGAGSGGTLTLHLAFNMGDVRAHDALIVAADYVSSTSQVPSVTDSQGNTFTMALQPVDDGNGAFATIWYVLDAKGGPDTVSLALPGADSGSLIEGYIHEYSGIGAFDGASGNYGMSLAMDSGPVTTTAAGDLLFAFGAAGAVTMGAGFQSRSSVNSNVTEDTLTGAPGQYDATATQADVGSSWLMVAAAFRAQ